MPYLKSTFNTVTGAPCVKLYKLVTVGGRQTPRQLGQWPTLAEAIAANPGVRVAN